MKIGGLNCYSWMSGDGFQSSEYSLQVFFENILSTVYALASSSVSWRPPILRFMSLSAAAPGPVH